MLDVTTRRRIDTLRDILVGKLPGPESQVEQIRARADLQIYERY